jgi:hypothetical protein
MYYYDVHVEIPNEGYSFGIKSEVELTDDEVINLAKIEKKFEEEWDSDFVDTIEEISEEQFNEWFSN